MGESSSKAERCRILGTYTEGIIKERSQCHCLLWSAGILEPQLFSLLGAVSANTSEVL